MRFRPLRSRLAGLALALPLLAAGMAAAHAQALPQRIAESKVVRVGVSGTYPPLESKDPATGRLVGFDIDLGEALAKQLGLRLDWQESGFPQLMPGMQSGRIDMVLSGISDLPARRETFDFVNYLKSGAQFYTMVSNTAIRAPQDLCGRRVATVRSTSYPAAIEEWSNENCVKAGRPAVTVVGVDRAPLILLEMQQGRVDAGVQGSETIPTLMDNNPNTFRPVMEPFTTLRQGIMFLKADTALRNAFAGALQALFNDGTYAALIAKWKLEASAAPGVLVNGEPIR
ncbi:ABC transporter substrate-binding protein [Roseomonas populi]|uniref:ABC transporter substrate-binding protein n=1 Tax=Roseomonas populi TaxID=3121582 RepID=A0ABT1XB54_9PROT|nr:ABC transporter substrate-binding protein [Roseomonas pecuniae]MCR0984924.1 ABC transporter substrate-binding protein [Roseomonas pecuniae]